MNVWPYLVFGGNILVQGNGGGLGDFCSYLHLLRFCRLSRFTLVGKCTFILYSYIYNNADKSYKDCRDFFLFCRKFKRKTNKNKLAVTGSHPYYYLYSLEGLVKI